LTRTSTTPVFLPAGAVAVQIVVVHDTPVAGTEPNSTMASGVKNVPVMVTTVPPASGRVLGMTLVIVGTTPLTFTRRAR